MKKLTALIKPALRLRNAKTTESADRSFPTSDHDSQFTPKNRGKSGEYEAPSSAGQNVLQNHDLLILIIAHLDKKSLPSAMRISPAFFDIISLILYRDITLGYLHGCQFQFRGYDRGLAGHISTPRFLRPKTLDLATTSTKRKQLEYVTVVRLSIHSAKDHALIDWNRLYLPHVKVVRLESLGCLYLCANGIDKCPIFGNIVAPKLALEDKRVGIGAFRFEFLRPEVQKVISLRILEADVPHRSINTRPLESLPSTVRHLVLIHYVWNDSPSNIGFLGKDLQSSSRDSYEFWAEDMALFCIKASYSIDVVFAVMQYACRQDMTNAEVSDALKTSFVPFLDRAGKGS